jgi:hypothetical protein
MVMRNWRFTVALLICGGFIPYSSKAQDDIDRLLKEGAEDGEYLLKGYLSPFMKSLGQGLNQGWYNTAKPHKVVGFDLTVTTSLMYVPNGERFYHVDNNKLNAIERLDGPGGNPQSGKAPTFFGPDREPTYRVKGTGEEFQGPPGLDLKGEIGSNALPVPMAQLGIGLPKGFDIKFRFIPKVSIGDDGEFNMWGVGVMHDVKQYIPGLKLLPFDLSGFVGYTRFKLDVDFGGGEVPGENQRGIFEASATTIQGVISKKISVLTVYGGAGYNIAKSKLAMQGWYDFDEDTTRDQGETNPINLDFAASGPRVTAGMRLKLAVFTFHADYTLQKYKSLTVGFGINVR